MEKEKELSHNQKLLQALAGKQAVHDWGTNLGDERLRTSRVMTAKLIRTGNEDVLDILAEYFGVRLIREDVIDAALATFKKDNPDKNISREQIRKSLERGSR